MAACETYPNGLPPSNLMTRDNTAALKRFEPESDAEHQEQNLDRHRLYGDAWNEIVREYAECQLTLPGDKLVAISGLAQFLNCSTTRIYLAFGQKLCRRSCCGSKTRYLGNRSLLRY